jgi:hypothetical protein
MNHKTKLPAISRISYGKNNGEHCKEKTKKEIEEMLSSYRDQLDNNETRSCFLHLDDINYLITYYSDLTKLNGEEPIKGLRIYFFREEPDREYSRGDKILKVGDKGQMSIIVVPTNNFEDFYTKRERGFYWADDMFNIDDKCLVITPGGEHTGLCPNNCGGSI